MSIGQRAVKAMQRLHPVTILIEALGFLKRMVYTIVLLVIFGSRGDGDFVEIFFVGLGGLTIVAALYRYLTLTYGIESNALVIRRGTVWKQERTIPLERIQNVNFKKGIVERVLGVVSVQIETASGTGSEAVLSVLGEDEANDLRRSLLQVERPQFQIHMPNVKVPALYEATFGQLALIGALGNRAMYIIGAVAGLIPFGDNVIQQAVAWIRPLEALAVSRGVTFFVVIGVLLFALGWVLSIIFSVVQYFGFRVDTHARGLHIKYGLVTHVENVVPLRRVQGVRLVQPILYRLMGYCEVLADTAGSFGETEAVGSNKLAPILPMREFPTFVRLALPEVRFGFQQWKPVSRKTIRRGFVRYLLIMLFITGVIVANLYFSKRVESFIGIDLKPVHAYGLFALPPIAYFMARMRYKYLGYALEDGFVVSRQGFWRQQIVIAPIDRMTFTSLDQSLFQRSLGLADLQVHTGTSTGLSNVHIVDLPLEEAISLQDELIQIQSTAPEFRKGGV